MLTGRGDEKNDHVHFMFEVLGFVSEVDPTQLAGLGLVIEAKGVASGERLADLQALDVRPADFGGTFSEGQGGNLETIEDIDEERLIEAGPDRIIPTENRFTSDLDGVVQLRLRDSATNPGINWRPTSIPSQVRRYCESAKDHSALHVKREDGRTRRWTYYQYFIDIKRAARAFIELGLEPLHSVAIYGYNSPEWFISCVGAIYAGGIACGLYTTNGLETNKYILGDAKANILVVMNEEMLTQILPAKKDLPHLKAIIQMEGTVDEIYNQEVISWTALMKLGEDASFSDLNDRLSEIAINQCAVLIYTSGTTGPPKGVMLSHDNIVYTTQTLMTMYDFKSQAETIVSYLPLNHIAAQIIDLWLGLFCESTIHFADKKALKGTLLTTLREARPTRFFGVPRVWEKFMEAISDQEVKESSGYRKKIVDYFKEAGVNHYIRGGTGLLYFLGDGVVYKKIKKKIISEPTTSMRLLSRDFNVDKATINRSVKDELGLHSYVGPPRHLLTKSMKERRMERCQKVVNWLKSNPTIVKIFLDKKIFPVDKKALGLNRCSTMICGAATLPNEVRRFFFGLDINILDCYGMSETCGLGTMSVHDEFAFGSIGMAVSGLEMRLIDRDASGNGELCIWGRNVMMGYVNQLEKTDEALTSTGFIRTGDIANCDLNDFFYLSGRVKDIIVTSGGDNVSPSPIEDGIKSLLPCLSNAVVIGDQKKYLIAFLTLKTLPDAEDPDIPYSNLLTRLTLDWCRSVGSVAQTLGEILKYKDESVFRAIQDVIDAVRMELISRKLEPTWVNINAMSNATKVQRWTILPKDLSTAGGELGPTGKFRRFFFYE
eukprot:maker-scaffold225_size250570-snap-gene-1.15 protein:Tk01784 transcript:maker-scaffold225_size250570-snap-gene-1.15-mRNA-1 annotation:"long-chain-fatty-acid-- ligase acsbg2-like isoform 1"